jgi:hypothetical protein
MDNIFELLKNAFKEAVSLEEISDQFTHLARIIMCSHQLRYRYAGREDSWCITSLELYLCTSSDVWRDPYVHANPAQLEAGTWYIHDDGRRAPLYSGIDLTCGPASMYGGLLIRELCHEHRWVVQRIVRGENNVVRTRKGNGWSEPEKLFVQKSIHTREADSGALFLAPVLPRKEPLYIGPRIGLRNKPDSDPDGKFRTAALRIATWATAKPKMIRLPA